MPGSQFKTDHTEIYNVYETQEYYILCNLIDGFIIIKTEKITVSIMSCSNPSIEFTRCISWQYILSGILPNFYNTKLKFTFPGMLEVAESKIII